MSRGSARVLRTVRKILAFVDPVRFMVPTPSTTAFKTERPDSAHTDGHEAAPDVSAELLDTRHTPSDNTDIVTASAELPPESTLVPSRSLPFDLKVTFIGSYPKDPHRPESNEDAWAIHAPTGSVAVLDGATESYAARRWAGILAAQWTRTGRVDVKAAQEEYRQSSTLSHSWAHDDASRRGSFATLAAVIPSAECWHTLIVGDSAVIVVEDNQIVLARPYTTASEFLSTPDALPSAPDLLQAATVSLDAGIEPLLLPLGPDVRPQVIVLATDAVAAWMLDDDITLRPARIDAALACKDVDDWAALVAQERATATMKVDDATIIVVQMGQPR